MIGAPGTRPLADLDGWRVVEFGGVTSTSDVARRFAAEGDPGRLWVRAEAQSAGRGRLGRAWESPPGNFYASALLVDPCAPAIAAQLGFVAGVALARAVEDLGAEGARLKWPNDLVCRGAKLAGLLVEGSSIGGRFAAVVGVGVNCASAPAGLAYPAAHLAGVLGRAVAPQALFAALARRFEESLGRWGQGRDFAAVRLAWLERAASLGERVALDGPQGRREGVFEGLDAAGRLLLRGVHGLEVVETADLALNPPAGAAARAQEKVSPA